MLEHLYQELTNMFSGMTPLAAFCQVWLCLFGSAAIWFVSRLEDWRRWGYILGMIGQPAWYYASISSEQWGITLLSVWYTYSWFQGINNYWIKTKNMKGASAPKAVDDLGSL